MTVETSPQYKVDRVQRYNITANKRYKSTISAKQMNTTTMIATSIHSKLYSKSAQCCNMQQLYGGKWWSNNKRKRGKNWMRWLLGYVRTYLNILPSFTLIFPRTGWDFLGQRECSRRDSVQIPPTRTPSHRRERSPPIERQWAGQVTWWVDWSLPRRWWEERWQTACRRPESESSLGSRKDDHWQLLWHRCACVNHRGRILSELYKEHAEKKATMTLIKCYPLQPASCNALQWSLWIKDTLGAGLLSFIRRPSSGGRFESLYIYSSGAIASVLDILRLSSGGRVQYRKLHCIPIQVFFFQIRSWAHTNKIMLALIINCIITTFHIIHMYIELTGFHSESFLWEGGVSGCDSSCASNSWHLSTLPHPPFLLFPVSDLFLIFITILSDN